MSYILEALKKAQAERQLGSAPTLLAVPVGASPAKGAAARRLTASIALLAVALAALLGVLAWRFQLPDVKPPAPVAVVSPPVQMSTTPPVQVSTTPPVQVSTTPPVPSAATSAATPAPPAAVPPLAVVPPSVPVPTPAAQKPVVAKPVPAPEPAPASAPAQAAAPEEERLPSLRELPEPIQRSVPPLVFGGYMYSKNPADRLLLIDKALRHEGEEVAPGLVLEKLLPKAAVMNYKGYRYRVPY
jgi:general secretion pathway protein B